MKLNGWPKGMDNIHQDNEIPVDALRRAVNMDITDSGKLRLRKGSTLSLSVSNAHSFWSDNKEIALFVHDNILKRFNRNATATNIANINAGQNKLAYVKVNSDVYFSCASDKGRVRDGIKSPWGIEVPTSPPELALTTGALEAGTYFAAMTYVLADGRESGASVLSSITLSASGGITTTALPVPADAAVATKRLYLSTPNGEVLYMAREVAANAQFINITTLQLGAELKTAYMTPPPHAIGLTYANGRIFMIDALDPTIVWHTEPLAYDLVNRRKNYYQFPEPVTVIAGTKTGLYVCSDKTYYIGNAGTAERTLDDVSDYQGVFGTLAIIPKTNDPVWLSERGAMIGRDGGALEILSEFTLVPGQMNNAAAMVREQNGLRQFVAVGNNTDGSAMQAGSYAEAEIIRKSGSC